MGSRGAVCHPVWFLKLEAYLTARGEVVSLSGLYWVWLPGGLMLMLRVGRGS